MTPEKIIIGSNNQGKLKEFRKYFEPFQINIVSQKDMNVVSIEETGKTFLSNAIKKARYISSFTKYPVIADDSGLVVEALDGRPGIYSARYAGIDSNDQDNIDLLMKQMQGEINRKAYFHCSLVYLRFCNDNNPVIIETKWEGVICEKKIGCNGFGYDPIFYIPELQKTAAQLSTSEKNEMSHRGQAVRGLVQKLQQIRIISKR